MRDDDKPLIQGTGAVADLVRSFDWSKTALGPAESWPQSLLSGINMMLASCEPSSCVPIEAEAQVGGRHRETAAAQELLVKLLQWQRETDDTTAMMQAACEMIGHHLRVDRVGFFEMVDDQTSRLTVCWTAGKLQLLSGDLPIATVGAEHVQNGRLGQLRAVSDYANEPSMEDAQFAALGVRAGIGVPIVRRSRWQSGLYVHSSTVREWTEAEIAFVREVANQTMEGVELARTQQAVRQSEVRLRKILESIGEAVIVTDVNRIVTGMNPIAEQLTGWPEGEARGHTLAEVFRLVDEQKEERTHIDEAFAEGRSIATKTPVRALLQKRDGKELPIEQSESLMREEDGTPCGAVLIFRDITDRETAERRVRQAYKMEALGQLTGGIAHDFNNILAIIMGNLELIAESGELESVARERIEQAIASTERAADLTRRLLAYARQQPLAPVVVDVVHLVNAAADFVRGSLGPAIALQLEIAEGLWHARIDRGQFENALLNLAVNARDAMPNGGRIKIECRNCVIGFDNKGEITPGEYLRISMADTGHGMSNEEVIRAAEPFFTTKPIGQGTGLGLSMVYGFLKQSAGHMQIESEIALGTTVVMYLPRSLPVAQRPEATRTRAVPETLPRGDELILVVEDERAIRSTISYLLSSLGYRVLEAEDGVAAMIYLKQPPRIDLLLTDVILPNGISGPALAGKAKVLQPEMAVIFSSGYTSNVLMRDYGLEEGVHLINKPFPLAQLAKMVRGVLDRPA